MTEPSHQQTTNGRSPAAEGQADAACSESLPIEEAPDGASAKRSNVRRSSTERRREIATVTLLLMAKLGLQGVTVSRIAQEVGMEPPSLYSHFSGRNEMFLAAIDILFERVAESLRVSSHPNILVRLREISEAHASYMTGEFEGFVMPVYEFMAAPRESGLSDVVGRKQRETVQTLAGLVEEGQRQGTIRADMDANLAAWELMMCFWAEDVTQLMGIDEYLVDGYSSKVLDLLLRNMEPH